MDIADAVGKTVASVTETDMVGRDTYKDEVYWTAVRIEFTDGTSVTLSTNGAEVYDPEPTDFHTCLAAGEHRIATRHRRDECPTEMEG